MSNSMDGSTLDTSLLPSGDTANTDAAAATTAYPGSGGSTPLPANAPASASPGISLAFLNGPVGIALGLGLAGVLAYFAYPHVAALLAKKGKKKS